MKFHSERAKILKFIKDNRVVTTSELAEYINSSWNTAEKYMLELTLEGKMIRLKKSGVNLWMLK